MRINRKAFAAMIAPVVAAGALFAPAIASAQVSKGFDIHNHTPYEMKLSSLSGSTDFSGPGLGSVIAPGGSQHYEVNYNGLFGKMPTVIADYVLYDGSESQPLGRVEAQMRNDWFNFGWVHCVGDQRSPVPITCGHPEWDLDDQITFSKGS